MPSRLSDGTVVHLFYLHGFASSPESGKALYLRERLAASGVPLHVPDFNAPDFSTLTVSRMLGQVQAAIEPLPAGRVGLVGSSLGGLVAIHAAARWGGGERHPLARMVLLAPAVDFASGRDGWLTEAERADWRRTGWREFVHHAYGRMLPVHYSLYEDGSGYDAFGARFETPTLVFQGTRDTIVDPRRVGEWVAARANVTLRMVDDDHQLQAHLESIWRESAAFLGVAAE